MVVVVVVVVEVVVVVGIVVVVLSVVVVLKLSVLKVKVSLVVVFITGGMHQNESRSLLIIFTIWFRSCCVFISVLQINKTKKNQRKFCQT